ncbi:MAG: signal recognition particle-docking protein FtsY [Gammaproteobacteria bacterium]|nr:signal recognition particle-docking protein FtsY [Gammaproteobacteria bacterium]
MLKFFKKSATKQDSSSAEQLSAISSPPVSSKKTLFTRLKNSLSRTRGNLSTGVATLVLGKKVIDDDLLEELETQLLLADVGVDATQQIMADLTKQVARKALHDPQVLFANLQQQLTDILLPSQQALTIDAKHQPYVILMVGINGAGKTTTIGKLAKRLQQQGKKVMLAAGDTFRAAAVEQLQVWGERNNIPVMAQGDNADSAAVIYDAVHSAQAKGFDVVIADTAGRLHTQDHLMAELSKVRRVIAKLDETAPHEVMLVLDAGIGQNALQQVKHFRQAIGVTGITLTKLDGTAKGGIVFAIAKHSGLPIRFIGVGEAIDDLQIFSAHDFVNALFSDASND